MIEEIASLDDPRVAVYGQLTETQLRNRLDPQRGIFIAESPKVIKVALDAGYEPVSILCERKHIDREVKISQSSAGGDSRPGVVYVNRDLPIYTGTRELLAQLTGYTLTRGVLCAMRRPEAPSLEKILEGARRIVIVNGVVDATNVGSIFRNAAALGIDAVLMMPNSCDAWNRRVIRVSMGSVFLVKWTILQQSDVTEIMHRYGFKTCAMALVDRSIGIDDPLLHEEDKLAIIMGNEGDGLPKEEIDAADYVVKIPMHHNVDSLNVAACSAIAFYELCR